MKNNLDNLLVELLEKTEVKQHEIAKFIPFFYSSIFEFKADFADPKLSEIYQKILPFKSEFSHQRFCHCMCVAAKNNPSLWNAWISMNGTPLSVFKSCF